MMSLDDIESIKQAWGQTLHHLLAEARASVHGDHEDRMHAVDKLIAFITQSPECVADLDEIARQAADDLIGQDIQGTLESLTLRIQDVERQLRALLGEPS